MYPQSLRAVVAAVNTEVSAHRPRETTVTVPPAAVVVVRAVSARDSRAASPIKPGAGHRLAVGLRHSIVVQTAPVGAAHSDHGPGVIVFDQHGEPESISAAAERWIGELVEDPAPDRPSESKIVQAVAARARTIPAGTDPRGDHPSRHTTGRCARSRALLRAHRSGIPSGDAVHPGTRHPGNRPRPAQPAGERHRHPAYGYRVDEEPRRAGEHLVRGERVSDDRAVAADHDRDRDPAGRAGPWPAAANRRRAPPPDRGGGRSAGSAPSRRRRYRPRRQGRRRRRSVRGFRSARPGAAAMTCWGFLKCQSRQSWCAPTTAVPGAEGHGAGS